MRGRRSRRRSAADVVQQSVVVVASATRSSVERMSGCRFSVFKIMSAEPGNTQQNGVRVQRVQRLNRQAERTTTLTLASCVLQLLLLLLLFCCWRSSAVDVVHQVVAPATRSSLCWTKHVRSWCTFFVFKIMPNSSSEPGNIKQNRVRVQRVQGLD